MAAEALPINVAPPNTAGAEKSLVAPASRARLNIGAAPHAARGCLRAHIDQELEHRLFELGACARPSYVSTSADDILGDQMYRARMLGFRSLELRLGTLNAITSDGILHPTDGETLDWWAEAVQRRGIVFQLAQSDARLLAYGAPVSVERRFASLLAVGEASISDLSAAPHAAASDGPLDNVSPLRPRALNPVPTPSKVKTEPSAIRGAMRQVLNHAAPVSRTQSEAPSMPPVEADFGSSTSAPLNSSDAPAQAAPALPLAPELFSVASSIQERVAEWQEGLERAAGHQSYTDLEQLFCQNYLPLRQALLDGHASSSCARATAQFSGNFSQSYARAFEALRGRGKRPTMVLDVPSLAFRLARQHAAPKHHMVLVDAMRFDIGARLEERLQLQLLGHASCVARGMLWSALPANSTTQLELLARGPEGLRQLSGSLDETQIQSAGADTRVLRPMRVGPHHLWKLDIVQHQVTHNPGPFTSTRLAQCSADVATSVGRFIKDQPQGTLIFVFGDHGFNADGSQEPSPEQVLVPYQAWLVRDTTRSET